MSFIQVISLAVATLVVLCNGLPLDVDEPRFAWIPDSHGNMHHVDLYDKPAPGKLFEPDEEIVYYLFTRNNPDVGQVIKKGDIQSLQSSDFDLTKPVKLTVHGWTEDSSATTNSAIRGAFLNAMDVNTITVDWGAGSKTDYVTALQNVVLAGHSLAGFLDWLNTLGVSFSDIHLIGHSLGGQLVGVASRSCTRGQVEYITSLDPAGPGWGSTSERIRKTDAKYVEALHTNAGLAGMVTAVGHNDFYFNGGRFQPGCDVADILCSHERSRYFMAYSIDNQKFIGQQCQSTAHAIAGVENCTGNQTLYMGGSKIKPEIGIFALNTLSEPPYYKESRTRIV